MNTDSNKPAEIIVPLGQALKDARIAASLSIEEVAEQLNFAPSTVRDFEDNLEQILVSKKYPTIYLRGYLSNYAKLVGLKTLELFVEYQQLATTPKKAHKLPVSELIIPPRKKRSKAFPLFLLFVAVVIAIIYFFQNQFITTSQQPLLNADKTEDVVTQAVVANSNVLFAKGDLSSAETTQVLSTESANEQIDKQSEVNAETLPATSTEPKAVDENVNTQANDSSAAVLETSGATLESSTTQLTEKMQQPEQLSLAFNADCWTEVFDATGKRIAFGLYKNGKVLSLAGIAPFQLKLGDPSVVKIQYQEQIIEGEFTPGRSARFSVPLS